MRESCPESDLVAAHLEDRLDAEERERFLAHLADCDDCRRETAVLSAARADAEVGPPVPAELKARAMAIVRGVEQPDCPDSETCAAYVEGRLDREDEALLLEHLADCDGCRREVVLLQMGRAAAQEGRPVPAQVRNRASIGGRTSRRHRFVPRPSRTNFGLIAAIAATILMAVALLLVVSQRRTVEPSGSSPVVEHRPAPERPAPPDVQPPKLEPPEQPEEFVMPSTPRPQPPAPAPRVTPDPEPPVVEAQPQEPQKPRSRETVSLALATVELTDLSGELSIRRKGKEKKEAVSGRVVVGEGDVLIAEKPASFYLLEQFAVALTPDTEIGLALEKAASAPAIRLERGEARVDASSSESKWYVATKNVGVWIEPTRARFAVSVEGESLGLSALSGRMSGRDDYGRPFDLRGGEKLVASAETSSTGRDVDAMKKLFELVHNRPLRTVISTGFDAASSGDFAVAEGVVEKRREFLVAVERGEVLTAAVKPVKDLPLRQHYVLRVKVRTNLAEAQVTMLIEDKAILQYTHRVKREQRQQWLTIEFSHELQEGAIREALQPGVVIREGIDRIVQISVAGSRKEAFAGEQAYLLVDDVQILTRER